MEPRAPSQSHSDMTRWMGVQEAKTAGNVHGGWIMKLRQLRRSNRLAERDQIVAQRSLRGQTPF